VRTPAALGAPGIVLCPVLTLRTAGPNRNWRKNFGTRCACFAADPARSRRYWPMVEPLELKGQHHEVAENCGGFRERYRWVGRFPNLPRYGFQFYRCGDAQMFSERVGLVHHLRDQSDRSGVPTN